MVKIRLLLFLAFLLLSCNLVFSYREALVAPSIDRYSAERDQICFINGVCNISGILNASDYWITDEGDLDDVADLIDIFNNYYANITGVLNITTIFSGDVSGTYDAIDLDDSAVFSICDNNSFYPYSENPTGYITSYTDTNVTTACSGNEVLLGNGTCLSGDSFGQNTFTEYRGSDLSDSDGDLNRTLDVGGTPINVFSDGFILHQDIDYVASGTVVTFLNYKWDEQYIRVET